MSRELQRFCKSQFDEFIADLGGGWGFPKSVIAAIEARLRGLHRRYLGLANLATILGDGAARSDYITAIPEVTYLSLALILKGVENASFVSMRQSIELVLKHIYFATHPVEYSWSAARLAYREITFQFLLDYLRKTDEIQRFAKGSELLERVEAEFHVLSRYVHVHSDSFSCFSHFGGHQKTHMRSLSAFEERSRELWPRLCTLMIVFFPDRFLKANVIEQTLVISGLSSNAKTSVNQYLRHLESLNRRSRCI